MLQNEVLPQRSTQSVAAEGRPAPVPGWLWGAVLLVALLRLVPFVATRIQDAPERFMLPVGFLPKDTLAYVALINQQETGAFLANPFTTEMQSGRFVLLLHKLLNVVHALTGIDPFWLWELSRIPLLMLFGLVLWRFTGLVLPQRQHRNWACVLILFSGGLDFIAQLLLPLFSPQLQAALTQDLWHLHGWSTFAGLYNPLWVAGLTLTLVCLQRLLCPGRRLLRDQLILLLGLLALYFTHPYSGLIVVSVACLLPALYWTLGVKGEQRASGTLWAVGGALLCIAAIGFWQTRDELYRHCSQNVLGDQALSLFWYPLTLGALSFFVLRGWQRRLAAPDAWNLPLAAWTIALVLLHNSTLLNGYKFVFQLHLPLCLAAAPAVSEFFAAYRARWVRGLVFGALFASTPAVVAFSVQDLAQLERPPACREVIAQLHSRQAGNVICSAEMGNLLPAYTQHRVWLGQWFMTPHFMARYEAYAEFVSDPAGCATQLRDVIRQQQIRYLVVPSTSVEALRQVLGSTVQEVVHCGQQTLIVL